MKEARAGAAGGGPVQGGPRAGAEAAGPGQPGLEWGWRGAGARPQHIGVEEGQEGLPALGPPWAQLSPLPCLSTALSHPGAEVFTFASESLTHSCAQSVHACRRAPEGYRGEQKPDKLLDLAGGEDAYRLNTTQVSVRTGGPVRAVKASIESNEWTWHKDKAQVGGQIRALNK